MSLQVTYSEIRDAVARYLGVPEVADWPDEITADWQAILKAGLRQFYWPQTIPLPEANPNKPTKLSELPYGWTFLRRTGELSLVADTGEYDLPSDFGSIVGRMTGAGVRPVEIVSISDLRATLANSPANAAPKYAALSVTGHTATEGTKHQIMFAPVPDADYTLQYPYSIIPPIIDESNPYPLGGAMHGETVLQSCLAAAEFRLHGEEGVHANRFIDRLTASLRVDREAAAR